MGGRARRGRIQRYVEDPRADEVLRAGQLVPGSTVMGERDGDSDDEERRLRLTIIKPRKPAKKGDSEAAEPEKVGVGAQGPEPDAAPEDREPSGDGGDPGSADSE